MSLLALHAGTARLTAAVVDPRGRLVAGATRPLARHLVRPGWSELAPEDVWQAALAATREVLDAVGPSGMTAVGVAGRRGTVVLWDRETLGAPRPAVTGLDRHEDGSTAAALHRLAAEEPHTWALVESGRYAVGTLDAYLVARMTRGTWHLTDASCAARTGLLDLGTADWSGDLCARAGVPRDAVPELVPTWGRLARTEPRAFLGLSLPVAAVVDEGSATLVALGCVDPGAAACVLDEDATLLVHTGASSRPPAAGLTPTVAWHAPSGVTAYALEGEPSAGARGVVGSEDLRVGGSGATDDERCRRLATLLGVPVQRAAAGETAAHGAALLAGLGTGVWASPSELAATWVADRRFDPVSG